MATLFLIILPSSLFSVIWIRKKWVRWVIPDFTVIKGDFTIPNVPSHQDKTWIRLWKENATELRERVVGWRKQNAITRIEKPSRLQRARRLGYKAKQGIIVVRMRV